MRKSAKDFGELELKNVGCCSVTDELRKSAKDFAEVELKNVGCCSVTAE
ncbi:hypothetical protein [Mycobacterium decipiens]|nr:hypothetical protein [Mycobacterium decipiens]